MKSKAGFAALATCAGIARAAQNSQAHSSAATTFDFHEVKLPALHQPASKAISQQRRATAADAVSPHVLTLSRKKGRSRAQDWAKGIRAGPNSQGRYVLGPSSSSSSSFSSTTNLTFLGEYEYVATIGFADELLEVIVDTGSSDTWVAQENFTCTDGNGVPYDDNSGCGFGRTYNSTFQHGTKPGVHFSIYYGDGEFATGLMGYEDVTVADLTVQKQQVALVNSTYWFGDGVTSGLMGLAYDWLTMERSDDANVTDVPYSAIFSSMVEQDLMPSAVFSIAMDRVSGSGQLAFGGLPPVEFEGEFTSTPIRMIAIENATGYDTHYTFYTIVPDAFVYGPSADNLTTYSTSNTTILSSKWNKMVTQEATDKTRVPTIVDSGTTLVYVPTDLGYAYLDLFGPTAYYNYLSGGFYGPCNVTTVPPFGVVINGTTFMLDAADLLHIDGPIDNGDGTTSCVLGVADGGAGPYILGDAFMNGVVSVFDVGASEMRFASRK